VLKPRQPGYDGIGEFVGFVGVEHSIGDLKCFEVCNENYAGLIPSHCLGIHFEQIDDANLEFDLNQQLSRIVRLFYFLVSAFLLHIFEISINIK